MRALLLALTSFTQPDPDPPLSDLMLFPHPELVRESLAFAEGRRAWLLTRREWDRQAVRQIDAEVAELDACMVPWNMLARAQCVSEDYVDDGYRRHELAELRKQIGWRAYYRGLLPSPVPLDRFAEVASCR